MAGMDNPVLHLDQFALKAEQLPEVLVADVLVGIRLQRLGDAAGRERLPVLPLHLAFLLIVVDQVAVDALDEIIVLGGGLRGHGRRNV